MAQNMMVNSQLLLLGLSLMMFEVYSQPPPGFNWAQWFNEQHVQYPKRFAPNNNQYCDMEMGRVNGHTNVCKGFNSFLHNRTQNIINVCLNPNTRCKNNRTNCHNSTFINDITDCTLTRGQFPPNCHYRGRVVMKYFVVACDPIVPRGPLLPVHLDKTF
ncbi:eosinophil cationic protein 2-like [Gracilinanus agilis]|uniref:eosinophil cationic protein 2-like n=1 Tax=Gracilinanus agilis TaxID=191870 RepID=UPI001CFF0D5B|nr:eosinophil cationic protein 2-like [Gracilinanus agilis]